jgi:hypothetical protein
VIANAVTNLFEASQCREVRDGVGEDCKAFHSEPGGQTRHVLLRDTDVQILAGKALGEIRKDAEAEVASEEHHTPISGSNLCEGLNERVSHALASSSASAASNSCPRAVR